MPKRVFIEVSLLHNCTIMRLHLMELSWSRFFLKNRNSLQAEVLPCGSHLGLSHFSSGTPRQMFQVSESLQRRTPPSGCNFCRCPVWVNARAVLFGQFRPVHASRGGRVILRFYLRVEACSNRQRSMEHYQGDYRQKVCKTATFRGWFQNVSSDPRNYRHDRLRHGICVPETCKAQYNDSSNTITEAIQACYSQKFQTIGLSGNVTFLKCQTPHSDYPVDVYDIAFGYATTFHSTLDFIMRNWVGAPSHLTHLTHQCASGAIANLLKCCQPFFSSLFIY